MLLVATLALARPPVPILADRGASVALGATGHTTTDLLVDPECSGTACEALRQRSFVGGFVQGQIVPWMGLWGEVGSELSVADAALAATQGVALDSGVYFSPWPARAIGAMAWSNLAFAVAGEVGQDVAKRWQLEAGGAARFGRPADAVIAWVGANVLIVGNDSVLLGEEAFEVPLAPLAPGEVVAGGTLMSEPLRGAASTSRVFLTLEGSVGARTAFGASLGVAL